MTSNWEQTTLGAICKLVQYGYTTKAKETRNGVGFIRGTDIAKNSVNWSGVPDCEVPPENLEKYLVKSGDILITRMGTIGTSALVQTVPRPSVFASYLIRHVVDITLAVPAYVGYVLKSELFERFIATHGGAGAVQPNINAKTLSEFTFPLPPLSYQQKISEYLGAIDDRITLLRETNATLEAIAQALFKSWFVDFDPVRAKAEGRLPDGIDAATAALFPDAFEETELGLVPRGWNVEPLDKVASFLNGLALQKFPPTGQGDLPVIKIAQLRKGDTIGADLAASSIKSEYIIKNGDVLFSWSGSLEVDIWCGGDGALNQHLFKVTSSRFEKWFYYLWTKHHLESFRQIAASKATTMGHIQRSHLTLAKVVVPSDQILAIANELFAPLVDRIVENTLQANTLSNVRDTLLPRLISGQLRIADAETELEKAMA